MPASEDRAVYRFQPREDSVELRDTLRAYVVDSALLAINLVARDTLVNGLKLYLYRINPDVDLGDTFETIDQQLLSGGDHRQHSRPGLPSTPVSSR